METTQFRSEAASDTVRRKTVSWPAIFAGATCSFALTLVMLALGTGLGLSSISPWGGAGISATTFKIATGLYLIVIAMISSAIGGFIAGRLRDTWADTAADEIYFRDTAHGFVTWAFASIVGAVLLATPVSSTLTAIAGGATSGAANSAASNSETYADMLLRPSTPSTQNDAAASRGEVTRMLSASAMAKGELDSADRTYLSQVVAARTGLSAADADRRVQTVMTRAKENADAARKATASLAFWITAALFIGALSAALAATEGGAIRDGTWRKART